MNKDKVLAEWELVYDGLGYTNFQCSKCRKTQTVDCKYDIEEYRFCPRCGTKMNVKDK